MNIVERYIVPTQLSPVRFQDFGAGIFISIPTKSALKKAIKKGLIFIDGEKASTGKYIHGGELIELIEQQKIDRKKFNFTLKVIFEDDHLAVILKPKGISTSGNRFATIANCLEQNLKLSQQQDSTKPYPVHRLDYDTSGLLLIGKTVSCRTALHQLFEENNISKTYHAVTVGEMQERAGIIEFPIDDKPALTAFQVLKTVRSEKFDFLNLVELKPRTGRTHQLRRHLFLSGNPIMGDKKYYIPKWQHKGYGLYLHATSLSFKHPVFGEIMHYSSDFPNIFTRIFENKKARN